MAFAWYAATTYPLKELTAEEQIARRGLQPFNPKVRISRIVRGRRSTVERPYIPGYIFINFDVIDDRWKMIDSTRGIQRLIKSTPEVPSRIRDDAMKVILDRCVGGFVDEGELDTALVKFIPLGALVRVNSGPFEGFEGRVTWTRLDRVKVLLSLFQRPTETKLSAAEVDIKV